MYNTYIMNQDLSEKVYSLQRNVLELHNLFELNMVANQARSVEDLLSKVSFLLKTSLGLKNLRFFINNNGYFQTKNINVNSDLDFEFDAESAPFLQDVTKQIIRVVNQDGTFIYKSFWNLYKLHELQSEYLKIFYNDEKPFCICSVSKKENDEEFTPEDVKYLNQVFDCIEPILIKFIKNKEQEAKIQDLNKTLHNLSILYNISQAVNFIDDLKRLISVILDKAIDTVNAEKGSLMLYDSSDNTLQVKVVYGLKDKKHEEDINNGVIECQKMTPDNGIAGRVFTEKKSLITNLGKRDPRFSQLSGENNVSSLICVPLIAKGECIGIINITNKKDGKLFNKKDLEFIEALANQAAIAVDNAQLYELATKDGLTKLYIHRHFYTLLESEIKRVQRYHHVLTLMMLDIDDFKKINDKYGHLIGDVVLKEIAAVIQKTIRHVDIAARYGGEEFTVILPETSILSAQIIAERLRQKISEIKVKVSEDVIISPTVSVGLAEFPNDAADIKDLIDLADKAMYESKANGKNCVHIYFDGKYSKYGV
ncbi:MAG: sensor domain-containing diguanylate cyclase [Candidatus Gastranaerophilales bacterium]|nr:sensor domain-containing diguanylate cyclase [Candidatus Gastranaerophilales bacterium]